MMKFTYRGFLLAFLSALVCPSQKAQAWVKLSEWKKPKVFGLAPSSDTAQISAHFQNTTGDGGDRLYLNKHNASILGLYPLLDELVMGVSVGGSRSELNNIPTRDGLRSLNNKSGYAEFAALYAFSDNSSLYIATGFNSKSSSSRGGETRERFGILTSYGVWALNDELGLGLGIAASQNNRKKTTVPLIGGAWQPHEQFRMEGWLPANLQARWKYAPKQAAFLRIELMGDAAMSEQLVDKTKTDIQLLGGQAMVGWSIGESLGIATAFLRLDTSLGVFKGQLKQEDLNSQQTNTSWTDARPVVDLKAALSF